MGFESYSVLLKDSAVASTGDHLGWMREQEPIGVAASAGGAADVACDIQYEYETLKGYSAALSPSALEKLHSCGDVELIAKNTMVTHCADAPMNILTQGDAPWGLQRISQPAGSVAEGLHYQYRRTPSGLQSTPVDVYVLDTGVNINHNEFLPAGRATWGWTYPGGPNADGHGHGTHVAGTIGGRQFGIAKDVNIIAVKVLDDDGSKLSDSIQLGIDWVIKRHTRQEREGNKRASIINMSLRTEANAVLDAFANRAVSKGIHVIVAAGNDRGIAGHWSPARAENVTTVGATNIEDEWADFSNSGDKVNILAPGVKVVSAGHTANNATATMSGTSMATPHVAGALAWLISQEGDDTPAQLFARLQTMAIRDVVTDVPANTPNLLLNNGH
ncbi:unnamed protein product [Rhizoctonia solani]|uniref:Peptidase S8/S53 domain-containing protein n=3 Tax=Rhizoctonia solani TaxID=456999 RepID=A0A8H3HLS2_9AGAM|nr:subtilisin-like serine protease family protein [Rhizoctonia solani AG-3 Rhs1AP]KEP46774.1 subtilisin-like serine protease family protein [Rhizoctonia solani 123E]CAE6443802.1 unnamed protein product [Rhizoctonia solani]CAE6519121.1 unnamed protein product [Rhizoctonia solani]